MKPHYQDSQLTLHCGDCRAVLAEMDPDSVDCVITSPPYYGLRKYSGDQDGVWGPVNGCEHEWQANIVKDSHSDKGTSTLSGPNVNQMNAGTFEAKHHTCRLCGAWRGGLGLEPTVEMYIEHMVEVFAAVKRVLKPTGSLWLNIGDGYAQQGGKRKDAEELERDRLRAIEKGYPTDAFAGYKGWDRACRTTGNGLKPKDLMLVPFRLALALQAAGWWVRSVITWCKAAPMPESVRDRPTKATELILMLTKAKSYYYDSEAVKEDSVCDHPSGNGYKREARLSFLDADGPRGSDNQWQPTAKRNMWDYWVLPPDPFPDAHFATFVEEVPKRCILAGTSERGVCAKCGKPHVRVVEKTGHVNKREPSHTANHTPTKTDSTGWAPTTRGTDDWQPSCRCEAPTVPATCLDPFGGSGTTGMVARKLGRRAVLIELSEEYCRMAERRVLAVPLPML